jgi:glycosyltransferase involved in cell wall biosynthesis
VVTSDVTDARTRLVLLATDSWEQINGISTLYRAVIETLDRHFSGLCRLLIIHAADAPRESSLGDQHRVIGVAPRIRFRVPQYPELLTGYISSAQFRKIEQEHGNIDVVHVATQGLVGLSASRYAKQRRKPCVGFYHTHWPAYVSAYLPTAVPSAIRQPLGRMLAQRWDQLVYGRCNPIVVHTARSEQWLPPTLKGRIALASEFVDCRRFQADENAADRDRTPGEIVFGFVGRIAREKNLPIILRHADRIKALGCRLVIVGDGPERSTLSCHQAAFAGWKSGRELVAMYNQMDLLLLPAESDTLGLVLLEAAACGIPAVALRNTVAADCIERYGSGVVVDAFDGELFGALRALVHSERFSTMRIHARAMAADHDILRGTSTLLRAWSDASPIDSDERLAATAPAVRFSTERPPTIRRPLISPFAKRGYFLRRL